VGWLRVAGRNRGVLRFVLAAAVAVIGVFVASALALAANPATSAPRWPGPLNLLRTHAWLMVYILTAALAALAVAVPWREWRTNTGRNDPLPPAVDVGDWVVAREQERAAVAALVSRRSRGGAATVAGLYGGGGFGKTTVALRVGANNRVRRHFRGRVYKVTVGRGVRTGPQIAQLVADVSESISGKKAEAAGGDPLRAGAGLGRLLGRRPRTLLVLDDVWEPEQLAPFLIGAPQCVRLVTTRVPGLLPENAVRPCPVAGSPLVGS